MPPYDSASGVPLNHLEKNGPPLDNNHDAYGNSANAPPLPSKSSFEPTSPNMSNLNGPPSYRPNATSPPGGGVFSHAPPPKPNFSEFDDDLG